LTQNKGKICKNLIITLVFEKNAIFFAENGRKSQKIVIVTSTLEMKFGILAYITILQPFNYLNTTDHRHQGSGTAKPRGLLYENIEPDQAYGFHRSSKTTYAEERYY
jgi:hypothetical protein